jgi:hypothetical protein
LVQKVGPVIGVELRAAAERQAYRSGMCLSHWIKQIVEDAVQRNSSESQGPENTGVTSAAHATVGAGSELNTAYAKEMEKLYDK